MDALQLLSGDAQTFLDKVWASHVHVHQARADDLVGLLSLDDVDLLLTAGGLRTPALRLAKDGEVLPPSRFTRSATLAGTAMTGLVDARKVLDLFSDGATVVLQGLHRYWPPLTDLVRDLELRLGHPCQANAYLTPPGSQGFALHSDSHDVFVFQTAGAKQWEVHESPGRHLERSGDERSDREQRRVRMEPGTSMYLPAGTPHAAQTQDSSSLHVTVGINQVPWRQVLERVVRAELDAPAFTERIPAGWVGDPTGFGEALAARLHALADRIAAADARLTARAETERFLTSRATAVRGGLRDRLHVHGLHDESPLRRRAHSVCELVEDGDRLRVLLGDRELRVPAHLRAALEHVRTRVELRPCDLADWLDEESRLVLSRRLVVEGLLEVAG